MALLAGHSQVKYLHDYLTNPHDFTLLYSGYTVNKLKAENKFLDAVADVLSIGLLIGANDIPYNSAEIVISATTALCLNINETNYLATVYILPRADDRFANSTVASSFLADFNSVKVKQSGISIPEIERMSVELKNDDTLVRKYFHAGFRIKDISAALYFRHGIRKSNRQLSRRMKVLGLRRKGVESPLDDILSALIYEIQHSGHSTGIDMLKRHIHFKYGLLARRQTVRDVLDVMCPGMLADRKRRRLTRRTYSSAGPNYLLHVDQYDKLAPYGFFIHGAIDGFSRKIMWLHVGNTNRKSATILHFYLKYALSIEGIPKFIRVDAGTENSLMLKVHEILSVNERDGYPFSPYFIGRSVHNQIIERWWGFLRTHCTQFWMDVFTEMINLQIYNSCNGIHYQLLQFCFTTVIRNDLCNIVEYWNNHKVRKVSYSQCPAGIPEVLYTVPEIYGKSNHRQYVDSDILNLADEVLGKPLNEYGCSDEFAYICLELMALFFLTMPNNVFEAIDLFVNLKSQMNQIVT